MKYQKLLLFAVDCANIRDALQMVCLCRAYGVEMNGLKLKINDPAGNMTCAALSMRLNGRLVQHCR